MSGTEVFLVDRRRVAVTEAGMEMVVVGVVALVVVEVVGVGGPVVVGVVGVGGLGVVEGRMSFPRRARSCGVDWRKRLCILGRFRAMSF